jgi:hypothetical protein
VKVLHYVVFDPTLVVLECNLCGTSVGLWRFTTVICPSFLLVPRMAQMHEPAVKYIKTGMVGANSKKNGKQI